MLRAAEGLLAKVGCRQFSISALAREVGLGKGTVYSHYGSQSLLIRAVLDKVWERLSARFQDRKSEVAGKSFKEIISTVADEIADSPSDCLGFPCCLRVSPCLYDGPEKLRRKLQESIDEGVKAGVFRRGINAELAGRSFEHVLSAVAPHQYLKPAERRRNMASGLDLYLCGILVEAPETRSRAKKQGGKGQGGDGLK